jgi:peptidoglycan hydrolase-like protein with peptidoglycan-binding domain
LTLKKGSKGNEVMELQKFLNNAGYNCGTADGSFGAKVKTAVIKFQIANGLTGDGVVGPKLRALLNQ